jgi:acetolactate synthase-1/2/3 large subunit
MKISNLVAAILKECGAEQVFGVSGGASLHLLKGIADEPGLTLTCLHHEQSVAMAAEAYSRISGRLGVGVVTSGPGATNLITGIAGAFYDSIPVIYITGQVSTNRMKRDLGVRQIGFQETPIVDMVKSVTKYAVTIEKPEQLEEELRKAIRIAQSGRKGPVLIDIPDDIQRIETEINLQIHPESISLQQDLIDEKLKKRLIHSIQKSARPIIVCGAGIQLSSKRKFLIEELDRLGVPIALTWGAKDLISSDKDYLLGTFGTHGERHVNIALNEADLIISIGSRLDLKATGTPVTSFAPNAHKIMIDIDQSELSKFDNKMLAGFTPIKIDIESDDFDDLIRTLEIEATIIMDWKKELSDYKTRFPAGNRSFRGEGVSPYFFIEALADATDESTNVIVDTGCAIAWTMQAWKTKRNQRIFHDFNNTAMGWSIPATIASALSNPKKNQICIVGDGSIMMALSDLSTLAKLRAASKVIILNNSGYAMIKQTQDQWFQGEYFASDSKTDLVFPNFSTLADAMGFLYYSVEDDSEVIDKIEMVSREDKPLIFEVFIRETARVVPIVRFGNPNHVMDPMIPEEFT